MPKSYAACFFIILVKQKLLDREGNILLSNIFNATVPVLEHRMFKKWNTICTMSINYIFWKVLSSGTFNVGNNNLQDQLNF